MKKVNNWGFSLIELLVVITILAIISVVAYTNFSGSTGKAKNSKKLNDITSIETGLQTFYQDKNYYPMPSDYNATTNVWGYDLNKTASTTATFTWTKTWDTIDTIIWASILGWWKVMNTWTGQVWAKWVIDSTVLNKQYLSQELSDPSLKDIKVSTDKTFKDYWIWKYIYAVYAKTALPANWNTNWKRWQAYNVAITLTDDQKTYLTKIIWNYDKNINNCSICPDSLIWGGGATANLKDWDSYAWVEVGNPSIWIPYPVEWF